MFGRAKRQRSLRNSDAAASAAVKAGPTTLVAQWLSAGVLREKEHRRVLSAKLRASRWHDAAPVAKAAFEIAVREAYSSPGWIPATPEAMATGMRAFFGADGVDRVPQDAAVRLIRAALGEDANVDNIPDQISFSVHGLVFVGLALDLAYDWVKLHAVLRRAEGIARDTGANPTEGEPHAR